MAQKPEKKKQPKNQIRERCRSIEVHIGTDALVEWVANSLSTDLAGYHLDDDIALELNPDQTITLTFTRKGPAW